MIYENLPVELFVEISSFIPTIYSFFCLARVSKKFRQLLSQHKTRIWDRVSTMLRRRFYDHQLIEPDSLSQLWSRAWLHCDVCHLALARSCRKQEMLCHICRKSPAKDILTATCALINRPCVVRMNLAIAQAGFNPEGTRLLITH